MKGILVFALLLFAGQSVAGIVEARKVLNRLILVINNSSLPKPKLDIEPLEQTIAYTTSNGEIWIGKNVLSNCARFGADSNNALACILSHELVHYYYRHFWSFQYGSAYAGTEWGKKMYDLDTSTRLREMNETQADQLGFYYAFSAGYKTWHLAERFLDSTYTWYALNDTLKGYPTLAQRKRMAAESVAKFKKYLPVFEMSNHMRVLSSVYLGQQQNSLLDFSILGYEHMFNGEIRTAEMYNNNAVARILKAQKYGNSDFSRLKLPLVIEQSSMLYEATRTRGYGDENEEQFRMEMEEARKFLEQAIALDPKNWSTLINMSIVMIALNQFGSASDYLEKAKAGNTLNDAAETSVYNEVKGILLVLSGKPAEASENFKIALKTGSNTSEYNRKILAKEQMADATITLSPDTSEKWNSKQVRYGLNAFQTSYANPILYSNEKSLLFIDSLNGYLVYEFKSNLYQCPVENVKIALSRNPNLSTSSGLKKGSSIKEVLVKYGKAGITVLGSQYNYWIYPEKNLALVIDKNGKHLSYWFYFVVN